MSRATANSFMYTKKKDGSFGAQLVSLKGNLATKKPPISKSSQIK